LDLQQNGSVAEYTAEFEALQYQITMHDLGMGVAYFISQFIKGLKPEIRYQLQVQVPAIMERAVRLAQIQETIHEKSKSKLHKSFGTAKQSSVGYVKNEQKSQTSMGIMSKERQLRDFCRSNNHCYYCREPYDPTHAAKCSKRPKALANALVLNDLDTTS
jgi:hypothetical protein